MLRCLALVIGVSMLRTSSCFLRPAALAGAQRALLAGGSTSTRLHCRYGSAPRSSFGSRPRRPSRGGDDYRPRQRRQPRPGDGEPKKYEKRELKSQIFIDFQDGSEALYGVNPVRNALERGEREVKKLLLQDKMVAANKKDQAAVEAAIRLAKERGIPLEYVDKGILNNLSGQRPHQGLVLQCEGVLPLPLGRLPEGGEDDVWLALDEVTDPQNLGAMLRSAYFLGARGVVVSKKNSAPLSPVVSKASAGALELMDVHSASNLPLLLSRAAEDGWRVLAADVDEGSVPLGDVARGQRTVIVMGSEGRGLRTNVKRTCTQSVSIAPAGHVDGLLDSLNVSVTAAIFLHHFLAPAAAEQ